MPLQSLVSLVPRREASRRWLRRLSSGLCEPHRDVSYVMASPFSRTITYSCLRGPSPADHHRCLRRGSGLPPSPSHDARRRRSLEDVPGDEGHAPLSNSLPEVRRRQGAAARDQGAYTMFHCWTLRSTDVVGRVLGSISTSPPRSTTSFPSLRTSSCVLTSRCS